MNSKDFYRFWNYIETRAFSPQNEKEVSSWLSNFAMFFNKLYEKNESFVKIRSKGNKFVSELLFDSFHITCKYTIEADISKFSFLIEWNGTAVHFEYDSQYLCELDYLDDHCKKEELSNKFTPEELEQILENKIMHPALHYHFKTIVPGENQDNEIDFPHDIRITAATKNPFLFLYQLSFQFLWFLEKGQKQKGQKKKGQKQEKELKRIMTAIFENKSDMEIAPGTLFKN